ncbi:MAG: DUF4272 domain-containing protein [Lachnospiraceae bacterium]|nr:DUF4272 domain-containing protein [Lachnospiraceae bacterium]
MEINQLYNEQLKQKLADSALSLLINNEIITRDDIINLSFHVGYMFTTESEELEALFSIKNNDESYYFAVQHDKLMMLTINSAQYKETIQYMKDNHPCLNEKELVETEHLKKRREKNNHILEEFEISTSDKLLCYFSDDEVSLRDIKDVAKRAVTCFFTVQIACDIANDSYQESIEFFKPLYDSFGLTDCLNSKEKRIYDGSYSEQDAIDMDWAYESFWALCWCLSLVDDITDADGICDCMEAISFVKGTNSIDEFLEKCTLKSKEEILDMHDLYYRYNWAINNAKVNPDASIGDLDSSVVIERRRALEWILTDIDDWYDLSLDA